MIAGLQAMLSKGSKVRSLIRLARLEGADDKSDKEGETITGVATNPRHFLGIYSM